MDAKEYLIKANKICEEYENTQNCNSNCPLNKYQCGLPKHDEDIDDSIELVEHYEEKIYPFGRCNSCGKEFNSELINEYGIANCPWCGEKIKGRDDKV